MGRDTRFLIGFAAAALVAGCGGSSGGDGPPPPPSVSLSVERSPIAPGQTASLSWTSSNTTSCTASGGWSGAKGTSGSERSEALFDATEFELTCSGSGGQASDSVTVAIDEAANEAPVSERFGTSADEVAPGELVTFTWTVSDPDGDPLRCVFTPTGIGPDFVIEDCNGANAVEFTYDLPGSYTPILEISDGFSTLIKRRVQKVTSEFMITSVSVPRNAIVQPDTDLLVSATVVSPLEVASIRATVGDRAVELESTGGSFRGTVSLDGLPRGPYVLDVLAEDINGEQTRFVQPFVIDQAPQLTITAPLNYSVATPELRVAAACVDDDPAGCGLEVVVSNEVVVSGRTSIDAEIDLSEFEGMDGVSVLFRLTDSVGQELEERRWDIHVESSPVLSRVFDAPGEILDVQGSRVLYRVSRFSPRDSGRPEIADMTDMSVDVVLMPEDGLLRSSDGDVLLTPYGTIFNTRGFAGGPPGSRLYEWNLGVLEDLGEVNQPPFLDVAGDFAVWLNTADATVLRNTANRSQAEIGDTIGLADVAANGTAVYANEDRQIVRFSGGTNQLLTNDLEFWNENPLTDGTRAVYFKFGPVPVDNGYERWDIVLHDGVEEVVLRDGGQTNRPEPGRDYQITEEWVAYTDIGNLGQTHVWLFDLAGEKRQLTFFGDSSELELLKGDGQVLFLRQDRRYVALPDSTTTEIGSTLGRVYAIDNEWYVSIGRSLFQILPGDQ